MMPSLLLLLAPALSPQQLVPVEKISGEAIQPTGVAAADLDGDGDVDALSVSAQEGVIAWYENLDGGGDFGPQVTLNASSDPGLKPTHVVAADVDGDGDADVLYAGNGAGELSWFENLDGRGSFGPKLQVAALDDAYELDVADVDLDGDLDVAAAALGGSSGNHGLYWYANLDGQGGFDASGVQVSGLGTQSLKLADLDGDGDQDVAVCGSDYGLGHGYVDWYENTDGLGAFTTVHSVDPAPGWGPDDVEAGDLDGDGDLDLVALLPEGLGPLMDLVVWYENLDGAGSFSPLWSIDHLFVTDGVLDATLLDVDGDLDLDVAVGSYSSAVLVFKNPGDPGLALWDADGVASSGQGVSLEPADFDGDGHVDLIVAEGNSNTVSWYRNGGDGYGDGPQPIATAVEMTRVVCGDVDGDGDEDLVGPSVWFENRGGSAGFGPPNVTLPVVGGELRLADLDGDADLDAAVPTPSGIKLLENADGLGTFAVGYFTTPFDPQGLEVIDLDLDGDLDLVTTGSSVATPELSWYRNDGAGAFGGELVIAADHGGNGVLASADLDLDGDADLVGVDDWTTAAHSYENLDGIGGSWASATISGTGLVLNGVLRLADVDGDSSPDLVTLQKGSGLFAPKSILQWQKNLGGAASFGSASQVSPLNGVSDVAIEDFDADGDLDLLAVDLDLEWYENVGGDGGAWTGHDADGELGGLPSYSMVAAGDLNGDGFPDGAQSVGGLPAHVAWSANAGPPPIPAQETPRLGVPPNPDAFKPGQTSGPVLGSVWDPFVDHAAFAPTATLDVLVISPTAVNVPSPWGTILCSPITVVAIQAAGAPFAVSIPASPSYVGAAVFSQGASVSATGQIELANALDLVLGQI